MRFRDSAVGASKAQGSGKDGHRSELQRRLDAGSSAYALLRALSALRNPAFPGPLCLSRSEPLHMSPHPLFPCLSPAALSLRTGGKRLANGVGLIETDFNDGTFILTFYAIFFSSSSTSFFKS